MDAIIKQVLSSGSRKPLILIIIKLCKIGTIFCSDGWKAYNKLADHLDLADVLHLPVNDLENYVDPETGAHMHTQAVEGI